MNNATTTRRTFLGAPDADGVKWWIAECETHLDSLVPITESYKFLQTIGRC